MFYGLLITHNIYHIILPAEQRNMDNYIWTAHQLKPRVVTTNSTVDANYAGVSMVHMTLWSLEMRLMRVVSALELKPQQQLPW